MLSYHRPIFGQTTIYHKNVKSICYNLSFSDIKPINAYVYQYRNGVCLRRNVYVPLSEIQQWSNLHTKMTKRQRKGRRGGRETGATLLKEARERDSVAHSRATERSLFHRSRKTSCLGSTRVLPIIDRN